MMNTALLYVASVFEAFRDQHEKFDEFLRIMVFAIANRYELIILSLVCFYFQLPLSYI